MTDDEFLARFESCAFTRSEWTHEAHVRMAWSYLMRHPFADALELTRRGINKLNDNFTRARTEQPKPQPVAGTPDGGLMGYHETITVAYVRLIASRSRANETFNDFRERNPDLFDRTLSALLVYYTKERLFSAEAKLGFVDPDLQNLPLFFA